MPVDGAGWGMAGRGLGNAGCRLSSFSPVSPLALPLSQVLIDLMILPNRHRLPFLNLLSEAAPPSPPLYHPPALGRGSVVSQQTDCAGLPVSLQTVSRQLNMSGVLQTHDKKLEEKNEIAVKHIV